ncbi:hypothetical protein YerA41_163c [Yersinia phage YerA41]|nr:hypothetical protein YerA41_163c [Yersinia phage YerA41]
MVKRLSSIIVILTLVGCSNKTPEPKIEYREVVRTVEVKVPVVVEKDPPPSRELPELPTKKLTKSSTPKEVAKAYLESVGILIKEVNWYRSILYKDNK